MADARHLKCRGETHAGSTPASGTSIILSLASSQLESTHNPGDLSCKYL